jgi:Fe-S-cluster containining protein
VSPEFPLASLGSQMELLFQYPKGIAFHCLRCGLCCKDRSYKPRLILALRSEVLRISERTGLRLEEFAEASGKRTYDYLLKKRQDGSCIFLRDNSCSIYELRPLVCRFYPFSLRKNGNHGYVFSYTNECPGLGKGRPLSKKFFGDLLAYALKELNSEINRSQASYVR